MLMTEIFYKTGYIHKKMCVIETNPKYVYFGNNSFINKNTKKFSFKENKNIIIYIFLILNFLIIFSLENMTWKIMKLIYI